MQHIACMSNFSFNEEAFEVVTLRSRIHGVLGCKDNERAAQRHNISDVLSQLEALEPVGGELREELHA